MNNIISQANQMELSGISNDTVQSMNAILYIIFNPAIQNVLFPYLSRRRILFGPIARMALSFVLMAMAMAYAAGVQHIIYSRGPCYSHPLACEAGIVGTAAGSEVRYRPNEVSVWLQLPFHFFIALGEIFGFVALNEFAYAEASTNMKALVKSFEQFTAALGAALGMALGPVSRDPWLVIMYSALAGTMIFSGAAFFGVFRKHDNRWHAGKDFEESQRLTDSEVATEADR
ncbi:oligopeptide transporter [Durotheca rogersii]|uniref:oligopeptide transporter n=1 Tax=Durotheca rogersii TaxID=419775 RepID=UPI00221F4EF6|nr:oligopeptide transporter [Durotheca rogersii]KAI5865914.1 oligopeptide transporter [Durotheca rogersii]